MKERTRTPPRGTMVGRVVARTSRTTAEGAVFQALIAIVVLVAYLLLATVRLAILLVWGAARISGFALRLGMAARLSEAKEPKRRQRGREMLVACGVSINRGHSRILRPGGLVAQHLYLYGDRAAWAGYLDKDMTVAQARSYLSTVARLTRIDGSVRAWEELIQSLPVEGGRAETGRSHRVRAESAAAQGIPKRTSPPWETDISLPGDAELLEAILDS